MKDYAIEKQVNNSKPFFVRENLHSFEQCYCELLELISYSKNQAYYVENDFFKNKFPPYTSSLVKYRILEREVTEFIVCSKENNSKEVEENKIINYFDYIH